MKKAFCSKNLYVFFLLVIPFAGFATDGKPVRQVHFDYALAMPSVADTLPEPVKEIPKSRKQAVPVPVKIDVKPVQIIKPKIIKPVIKAIH